MKSFQIIEIVGMTFVLFSIGWELFFSETVQSTVQEIELKWVHFTLDQLHFRQHALQEHIDLKVHYLSLPNESRQDVPGFRLTDKWDHSLFEQDFEHVSKQSRIFGYVKMGLFAGGSLLLIVAKIIEYKQSAG